MSITKQPSYDFSVAIIIEIMLMFDYVYAASFITLKNIEQGRRKQIDTNVRFVKIIKILLACFRRLCSINDDNSALYNKSQQKNKGLETGTRNGRKKNLASARTGLSNIHLSAVSQTKFINNNMHTVINLLVRTEQNRI